MSSKPSPHRSLARSAGLIGVLTFVSRILGFVRDILIAFFFGTSNAAEAFVVSFKIPNLLRDLVGEGAVNAAIVPVLSETRAREGHQKFQKLALTLAYWFLGILFVTTVLGVVFAPVVVRLAAPGFFQDPEKFGLTVELTRYIFPFIFFIGMSALMMGVLNTLKNFGTSAIGSSLLNISMIIALVVLFAMPHWGVHALVGGVLVGGVFQCVVQLFSFRKEKFKLARVSFFDPAVKKIMKLLLPRLLGASVYQISVFVDTILASFYWIVGAGGQSALYYASRLFQLPLAIFGISFAQAALPTLSGHYATEEIESFKEATNFSMRQVFFTTIPAAVGLAVFSDLIVRILFERSAFTSYSTLVTSRALLFYSVGLLSCAAIKVLVSAFYALQDTRTPVKTAALSLVANIILNLALMGPLKIGGLALATSLSATMNAVLLYYFLRKRLGGLHIRKLAKTCLLGFLASLVMALLGFFVLRPWIQGALADGSSLWAAVRLSVSIGACFVVYVVTCFFLGSEEARNIKKLFVKK